MTSRGESQLAPNALHAIVQDGIPEGVARVLECNSSSRGWGVARQLSWWTCLERCVSMLALASASVLHGEPIHDTMPDASGHASREHCTCRGSMMRVRARVKTT
ncbi:MAG: hypothetical protein Q6373_006190 [Candidatus Sigynarchaeota archaeon]